MSAIAFSSPFVLIGLLALPALWWLLRVTPPRPNQVTFPPLRLLLTLTAREETPARTPWWLTALRLALAAAIIIALAGPVYQPRAYLTASGPVWLILDNGYSAGPDWAARKDIATAIIDQARQDSRPILFAATADGASGDLALTTADDAATRLAAVEPRGYAPERGSLLEGLGKAAAVSAPGDVVWIAEPVDDGRGAAFATALAGLAPEAKISLAGDKVTAPPLLKNVDHGASGITASIARIDAATPTEGVIRALDQRGRLLGETAYRFENASLTTSASFDLPLELRNEISRVEVQNADSTAAVQLLDDRWRRRTVGLISGTSSDRAQPLLSPTYFLSRALLPFADLREPRSLELDKAVKGFIDDGLAAIVMADVGTIPKDTADALSGFMDKGGVLIRFAGPRLAAGEDELVPVPLRRGGRVLGGTLSWEEPQPLTSVTEGSPFGDITVPDDVTVEKQVLAEPGSDVDSHTFASLKDGTPLVTARQVGNGWLILFHVTADTTWSNLPISGVFVEMLRRSVALGRATGETTSLTGVATDAQLAPLSILDGTGRLVPPGPDVKALASREASSVMASRETPPGLYGSDDSFRAVNLMKAGSVVYRLDSSALDARATRWPVTSENGFRLEPYLFAAAFLMLIADALAIFWLLGAFRRARTVAAALAVSVLALGLFAPAPARAEEASPTYDQKILDAVSVTRFAYVITGDDTVDEASRLGLWAIARYMAARTALEAGEPAGVDPAKDELSVYPILYWPIVPTQPAPSADAMQRVDAFMKTGGTVIFDTRDQLTAIPGSGDTPEAERLKDMLSTLDIPPLEPVPSDHVLTKSFYLLTEFPGRYTGSPLWVEQSRTAAEEAEAEGSDTRPVREGDGVTPIMITGNDFAGGWAADDAGSFLYPVIPGDNRQREMALRAGVNIVMYALTGNYKADQVHVPALLERLGQ